MSDQSIFSSRLPSILIVDDNPENLRVLGKFLQENNYLIEFAINGDTALSWLNKKMFDLILLDINMPGINGFDVCRKIRSNPAMKNLPVIFLSAESERESILKGFEIGAQDYITKPFDSRELLVRVKTHLALRESIEKLESLNKSLDEIVIDRIEQLIRANEKLEKLNQKLIDLDKIKSDFLTLISHELRTPLNGINGIVELLKLPVDSHELLELIENLDLSVKRLERFSLDALLFTRLKTNQFGINSENIHLFTVIDEVLSEENEIISSKKIRITKREQFNNSSIKGNTILVKKCIANIIDNALRFSPNGGFIMINIYVEGKTIIIEVRDHGPGFSKNILDRMGDLFLKGEDCKDKCRGIGLTISRMIMELHDGKISISNNTDKGASVKLLFVNINNSI